MQANRTSGVRWSVGNLDHRTKRLHSPDGKTRLTCDTLVVDTVGFNDKTWLDRVGDPHGDQLHAIEDHDKHDMEATAQASDSS